MSHASLGRSMNELHRREVAAVHMIHSSSYRWWNMQQHTENAEEEMKPWYGFSTVEYALPTQAENCIDGSSAVK